MMGKIFAMVFSLLLVIFLGLMIHEVADNAKTRYIESGAVS